MEKQLTSNLMMVRPVAFRMNEQTAVNNFYQNSDTGLSEAEIQAKALLEFDEYVEKLRAHDLNVTVILDTLKPSSPDSIFPNNWISFHESGEVILYPMFAENRRYERRLDILDILKTEGYQVEKVTDFSDYENSNRFLEGTGSMILDRENKIVYAAISERTDTDLVEMAARHLGYHPVVFEALQTVDGERLPIYHTNVMMAVADKFAIICLDSIDSKKERREVVEALENSGKEIIDITEKQVNSFAGNMLQVENMSGHKYLVMSRSAHTSLTNEQLGNIEKYCPIIYSSLDTIEELGGGSARCMIAEVFLPKQ